MYLPRLLSPNPKSRLLLLLLSETLNDYKLMSLSLATVELPPSEFSQFDNQFKCRLLFPKSTIEQMENALPGHALGASPGRCEVSETNFSSDQLAADKRAVSLLYRSVRGADSREPPANTHHPFSLVVSKEKGRAIVCMDMVVCVCACVRMKAVVKCHVKIFWPDLRQMLLLACNYWI